MAGDRRKPGSPFNSTYADAALTSPLFWITTKKEAAVASIHHQLAIRAPIAQIYAVLSEPERIGTWWDQQTAVQTDAGLVLEHNLANNTASSA